MEFGSEGDGGVGSADAEWQSCSDADKPEDSKRIRPEEEPVLLWFKEDGLAVDRRRGSQCLGEPPSPASECRGVRGLLLALEARGVSGWCRGVKKLPPISEFLRLYPLSMFANATLARPAVTLSDLAFLNFFRSLTPPATLISACEQAVG